MAACENCGWDDPELVAVCRVYLEFGEPDAPPEARVVPEPEHWCVSCASQYPCEPLD